MVEGHHSLVDKLDEVLGVLQIRCMPRIGPTAGREGLSVQKNTMSETRCSYRPDPKHVQMLAGALSLEDAGMVATPFTRDTGKGQANTLNELSSTEQAIYMSGCLFL